VFPPILNELPPPPLELFDLDEQFASERVRLAHATNLCKNGTDEDLEYFTREAGEILGVTGQLKVDSRTGKHILEYIFKQIVNWKKLNQDAPMDVR
jgi:intraflagellar transport protein 52